MSDLQNMVIRLHVIWCCARYVGLVICVVICHIMSHI